MLDQTRCHVWWHQKNLPSNPIQSSLNPIKPPFSNGFPVVFQWFSQAFPMVFPWNMVSLTSPQPWPSHHPQPGLYDRLPKTPRRPSTETVESVHDPSWSMFFWTPQLISLLNWIVRKYQWIPRRNGNWRFNSCCPRSTQHVVRRTCPGNPLLPTPMLPMLRWVSANEELMLPDMAVSQTRRFLRKT